MFKCDTTNFKALIYNVFVSTLIILLIVYEEKGERTPSAISGMLSYTVCKHFVLEIQENMFLLSILFYLSFM